MAAGTTRPNVRAIRSMLITALLLSLFGAPTVVAQETAAAEADRALRDLFSFPPGPIVLDVAEEAPLRAYLCVPPADESTRLVAAFFLPGPFGVDQVPGGDDSCRPARNAAAVIEDRGVATIIEPDPHTDGSWLTIMAVAPGFTRLVLSDGLDRHEINISVLGAGPGSTGEGPDSTDSGSEGPSGDVRAVRRFVRIEPDALGLTEGQRGDLVARRCVEELRLLGHGRWTPKPHAVACGPTGAGAWTIGDRRIARIAGADGKPRVKIRGKREGVTAGTFLTGDHSASVPISVEKQAGARQPKAGSGTSSSGRQEVLLGEEIQSEPGEAWAVGLVSCPSGQRQLVVTTCVPANGISATRSEEDGDVLLIGFDEMPGADLNANVAFVLAGPAEGFDVLRIDDILSSFSVFKGGEGKDVTGDKKVDANDAFQVWVWTRITGMGPDHPYWRPRLDFDEDGDIDGDDLDAVNAAIEQENQRLDDATAARFFERQGRIAESLKDLAVWATEEDRRIMEQYDLPTDLPATRLWGLATPTPSDELQPTDVVITYDGELDPDGSFAGEVARLLDSITLTTTAELKETTGVFAYDIDSLLEGELPLPPSASVGSGMVVRAADLAPTLGVWTLPPPPDGTCARTADLAPVPCAEIIVPPPVGTLGCDTDDPLGQAVALLQDTRFNLAWLRSQAEADPAGGSEAEGATLALIARLEAYLDAATADNGAPACLPGLGDDDSIE